MAFTNLRPSVLEAREKLAEGRQKLREQHEAGLPGSQVGFRLADLFDTVLLELYRAALRDVDEELESLAALVAHGGYGRRDVAPYSDLDLMLVHQRSAERRIAPLARRLVQSLYDAGLQLGFSLRTPGQACSLASKDMTVFTSLVESRHLSGNVDLFTALLGRFRRDARRWPSRMIRRVEQSRREERHKYGETVYLLEPNVKRSPGGLRDLQLLRWVGLIRYGETELEGLESLGLLLTRDRQKLDEARQFLLRLRHELHFRLGKSQDVLDRGEQLRIADLFGYGGEEGVSAVEHFLREYIEHTSEVRYTVAHFLATAKARVNLQSVTETLLSRQVEGNFRVGPVHIGATRRGLEKVRCDLAEILHLMELANRYNSRIDHTTWQAIREAMIECPSLKVSTTAAQHFLALMSQPGRLGSLLRRLHELRVLEKLVPPMAHVRCLMQFNAYHKYTVDEHSIRAVECATEFLDDPGPLGEAYRGVSDKRLLHLALLLHDLGKGVPEDHSEAGLRLAAETAEHLGLSVPSAERLKFLVHKHLRMSHLAQRRDIRDQTVVVQLAVEVGSAEILQMLYVLTCADLAAVGPGVLTSWKLDLITQLYLRARKQLTGASTDLVAGQRREALKRLTANRRDADWWQHQIAALPHTYLVDSPPEQVVETLDRLRRLPRDQVVAWGQYLPQWKAIEYTVGAYEEITPGIFHKLTGALTAKGGEVLSAEIHTLAGRLVLDRFYVQDMEHADQPPAERIEEVTQSLVSALTDQSDKTPSFRCLWSGGTSSEAERHARLPTQVRIDNNTSQRFTILDIFAHDCRGLLYTIARTIFQLGLSVHVAKISTHLDQVLDVFYVTDQQERKVTDQERLNRICDRLLHAIEDPSAAGS